jgi:uncharacterized damage-inducible protein DinB
MSLSTNTKNTRLTMLALAACVLMLAAPVLVSAQNGGSDDATVSDFLNIYNFTAGKVAQLAEAMPEDKFDWRPAEGIRSVKESVLHTASANYFFGSQLGATVPEGINPQQMEKTDMSKEEAITALKESLSFIQDALKNMKPEQMDEDLKLMGNNYSKRQVMFIIGDHVAEHLGQLIAYARMNGVAPPWSQPPQ